MKKECEIVKDLFPSYVENLVSEQTKEYVESHITNCSDCRKILESIQTSTIKENKEDLKAEEVEIRHLKKYKRKMAIIKIIMITLIVIIVGAVSLFSVIFIPKYSLFFHAYNKIKELENENNFKFTIEQYHIYYDTKEEYRYSDIYYYKDGKYKREVYSGEKDLEEERIEYWEENSSIKNSIDEKTKTITTVKYANTNKSEIFDVYSDIKYYTEDPLGIVGLDIRNDNFNGRDCYVVRFGRNNTSSYREIWIDKETMIQVREVQEIFNKDYWERTILIELNKTTDDDVILKDTKGYKIEK